MEQSLLGKGQSTGQGQRNIQDPALIGMTPEAAQEYRLQLVLNEIAAWQQYPKETSIIHKANGDIEVAIDY